MSRRWMYCSKKALFLSQQSRYGFVPQLLPASGSDDIAACMRVSKAIEYALGSMSQTPKTQEQRLQVSVPLLNPHGHPSPPPLPPSFDL